jgi:hypothetical protein
MYLINARGCVLGVLDPLASERCIVLDESEDVRLQQPDCANHPGRSLQREGKLSRISSHTCNAIGQQLQYPVYQARHLYRPTLPQVLLLLLASRVHAVSFSEHLTHVAER